MRALVAILGLLLVGHVAAEFPVDYQVLAMNQNALIGSTIGNEEAGIFEHYIDVTKYIRNASGSAMPVDIVAALDSSAILFDNGSVTVTGNVGWDHPTQSDLAATLRWVPLVQGPYWNYTIPFSKLWAGHITVFAWSNVSRSLYAWDTNDLANGYIDNAIGPYAPTPIKIGSFGGSFPAEVIVEYVTTTYKGGSFALVPPGKVYHWGYTNPIYFTPSYGPIMPSPLPGTIAAATNFSHICGSWSHLVLFSQETGKFYWWGKHYDLAASSFSDVVESPARVGEFANATIVELACTGYAVLARTLTGDVWAFGTNEYGEFANGEWASVYVPPSEAVKIPFPAPVKRIFDNKEYDLVALTEYHSYAWGENRYLVAGIPGWSDNIYTPQIITFNGDPVKNASDAAIQASAFLVLPRQPVPSTPPATLGAADDTLAVWLLVAAILAVGVYTFIVILFF